MYKLIIILLTAMVLCSCAKAPALEESPNIPSAPPIAEEETSSPQKEEPTPAPSGAGLAFTLEERMASISFEPVSGQYARNSIQGGVKYTELFVLDKSSFVRAALNETEEEVFVYNYHNDEFTYMYYFEGELLSKVVYDMGTEAILEDEDDLAELLIGNAENLKDYFFKLLDMAGIGMEELE